MRVRRIEISNFRGIHSLDWRIPAAKRFFCLIGPGDSAKSTIIDALHLALGERWSLSLSDTDFYKGNTTAPAVIRVALGDLPPDLQGHNVLGLHLSGIDPAGDWQHDPGGAFEPCAIVELSVDADLEPTWSIYRPGTAPGVTAQGLSTGVRRKFAVFKVDERIDNHLRWTRTSALTRLTDDTHGTAGTLASALTAARGAVKSSITPALQTLTDGVAAKLSELGSGEFAALEPGLDTSLSGSSGNLALFEGEVPLTSYGLGTRRLAAIGTQELASQNKSLILMDEVEHGLEPHRLVHLLRHLRDGDPAAQVFVTTHSPVAVEQLESEELAIVRSNAGLTTVALVPSTLKFAQSTLRGGPSAFLAKRVVVTEGKTEFGLLLGMVEDWDRHAVAAGASTSAAYGVAIADGNGSNAPARAKVLAELGYTTGLVVDNDDRTVDTAIADASAAGVTVLRWQNPFSIEQDLVSTLDAALLTELLGVATVTRADAHTVRSDLLNLAYAKGLPPVSDLDVGNWISIDGYTLESARELVGTTAKKTGWFKSVPAGRLLAEYVIANASTLRSTPFGVNLSAAKAFIYPVSVGPAAP